MIIKFSFKKKLKLLTSLQYKNVFKNSYQVRFKKIIILGCKNYINYPRLGISIKKKDVKKSYQRNYLKRLIREFFRLHKENFLLMDFIVIVKKKFSRLENRIFLRNLKYLWSRYYF
ncbi:MAG: ribonuclease P protein component [Buchnera aphidicola (Periphyllus lyropictus)]|uniref:ribonuclease P protein component n=1 Tax=Buchnera aphidicola TaxID=9 RepID=UPI001EC9E704|nr:ribonuclease P protein component [Buchnera aphidicola]NIH16791.1 ribonuclease P protein component [Buchnera aphidicola (Periphyllus lyropictus)]USS94687.1 ribonuclease P protein component [Buchnera aphidicola (Periphyllus lyropictus)]